MIKVLLSTAGREADVLGRRKAVSAEVLSLKPGLNYKIRLQITPFS